MPTVSNVSAFRRVTPGILASQRLAMSNDIPDVGKGEVAIALKRAAQPLKLSSTAYHVLDILLGLSKAGDWKADARPIVAISNEKLAAYVGRSERTVIRAVKQLVEAQILAYRDSSTGRRWVHRDDLGQIKCAYGLDFTPAKVRYHEIKKLADEWQAELNAEREARRATMKISRAIVDIVNASDEVDLSDFHNQMLAIMESGKGYQLKAQDLCDLYDLLLEALAEKQKEAENSLENDNMAGEGDTHVSPLYITNSPDSYIYNRTSAKAAETPLLTTASGGGIALEKNLTTQDRGEYSRKTERKHPEKMDFNPSGTLDSVSISLIEGACTTVQSELGVFFSSWPELIFSAEIMRIGIGLSETAYSEACGKLGRRAAAAILAVVTEKTLREPERISRPGGYFRACVDRAVEGKLALTKSLFGLANS